MPRRKRSGGSLPNNGGKRFRTMLNEISMQQGFNMHRGFMGLSPRVPPISLHQEQSQYWLSSTQSYNLLHRNFEFRQFSSVPCNYNNSPNFMDSSLNKGHQEVVVTISGNQHETRDVFVNNLGNMDCSENRNRQIDEEEVVDNLDADLEYSTRDFNLSDRDDAASKLAADVVHSGNQNSNCCISSPYLIFKDSTQDCVQSLRTDLPSFFKQLQSFVNSHKLNQNVQFFCKICLSGAISSLGSLIEHLKGKCHKKNVKNKCVSQIKITICRFCFKINCYPYLTFDDQDLPRNTEDLFRQMYADAFSKTKAEEEKVPPPPPPPPPKNKNVTVIHLVLSKIGKDFPFPILFDELVKFSKECDMDLQHVFIVDRPKEKVAYCRFFRSLLKPELFIEDINSVFINRYRLTVQAVSSAIDFMERIQEEYNQNNAVFKWSIGNLSPCSEIFYSWERLIPFISKKLQEMDETSQEYPRLTCCIRRDLLRATAGYVGVKAIDFFGSRVTGLALFHSDFDLQITTGSKCTVRALAKHLKHFFTIREVIPWAKVPIIRIQHDQTNSKCDISLNNLNGVINSQLLRFYLNMDERVKWLVVTIKLWASMNLINGSFTFTSYALAWLALFFLMQKDVSLVPTVQVLTKLLSSSNQHILHSQETNMTFSLDMNELIKVHNPKVKCLMSKSELYQSFFQFCLRVTSSLDALDPFLGQTLTRKELNDSCRTRLSEGNLNKERCLYSYSFILIDPIKHSSNICASVNSKVLNNFRVLAQQTLRCISGSKA